MAHRNLSTVQEPIPGVVPGKLCRVHVPVSNRPGWQKCQKCPAKIHVPRVAAKARKTVRRAA